MVRALRRVATKAHHIEISDSETIGVGGLERTTGGVAALYNENFTTGITIGGKTALAGATVIDVDGAGNANGGVRVRAGSTADLTLGARGATVTLNQTGQTALNATFTGAGRTSIIGALNALVDGGVAVGAPTVTVKPVTVDQPLYAITFPSAINGPFFWFINGVFYSHLGGHFVVSTTTNANDTWTWQDPVPEGQLKTGDLSIAVHW